jgi:hypothetical protein
MNKETKNVKDLLGVEKKNIGRPLNKSKEREKKVKETYGF